MTYIHELPSWPSFTWDSHALTSSLAAVRHKQGKHLGMLEALGFDLRAEVGLSALTTEIVKSSAIEGEDLAANEVRSSIATQLGLEIAGLEKSSRPIDGVVEMMLDATRASGKLLTKERLLGWHGALFPSGRSGLRKITVGAFRTDEKGPMQVVSGAIGRERVHFQAPPAAALEKEMSQFLEWFESPGSTDLVLQAAIAHLYFVTIHPFDDGNGRIARAIAELALARADQHEDRFYSMSSAIESRRKEYYIQLESAQRGSLDITAWLAFFLDCLNDALDTARESTRTVLDKARLWQHINTNPVNERQRIVINRMLDNFKGHLSTSKYAKLAKCSNDTALRDIQDLLKRGIILKNDGGGRSTSYRLMNWN